jgi:hypothetical protein
MTRPYRFDLTDFIDHLEGLLPKHAVGNGQYQRHQRAAGHETSGSADAYGCADAANILYTLGTLPAAGEQRSAMVESIRSFQNAESGVFYDPTHSDHHTTAHCVAALELFDEAPAHPLRFLSEVAQKPGSLEQFLDELDWAGPWRASHNGAGIAAALAITGEADEEWFDRYFAWLDAEVSPETGFWRRDRLLSIEDEPGLFGNLAGSFHYHFNYVYFRRAIPHPERVIDSCLTLLADGPVDIAEKSVGFKDIDWIFCINRAERQSGYRRDDVIAALEVVCARVVEQLSDPQYLASDGFDDLHSIFGGLCAVAELQQALPNSINTGKPLRLVLDRRPFI